MSGFRSGTFERERVTRSLRRFSPLIAANRIEEIDLEALKQAGKRLILLDVDNTLLPWKGAEVPDATRSWIEKGRALGLEFCVISNTRNEERLKRITESVGLDYILGKFKPSTFMYKAALDKHGAKPEEAVMVGDQLLTDVWGANRTGIDAIWVERMPGPEFFGTSLISRRVEGLIVRFLYKSLTGEGASAEVTRNMIRSKGVRQFLKFAVVGGSSFAIDYCLRMTLMYAIPYGDGRLYEPVGAWVLSTFAVAQRYFDDAEAAAVPIAAAIAASVAIVNSFYWNRRWTWRIQGKEEQARQFRRFVLLAGTGMALNTILSTVVYNAMPFDGKPALRIATVVAAGTVAFWNFFGQRLYAFRGATQ
jgi:hypothetical protein